MNNLRSFKRYLQCLQGAQYVENIILNNGDNRALSKLQSNGKIFQKLLQKKLTDSEEESKHFTVRSTSANINHRSLDFLHQEDFQKSYWDISSSHLLTKEALKRVCPVITAEEDTSCSFNLVSDHFVPESRELETFYNIQRGRKIWWMRHSADPSRYLVEPFDIYSSQGNILDETFNTECLSSAIKSAFPFKKFDMEDIMLVPLYKLRNWQNDQKLRVSLIRTVIYLDSAISAMLLDAIDHDKEGVLLLNKQLTPFQCLLLRNTVKTTDEIDDLCLHINHVLCRAGLRVLYQQPQHSDALGNLSKEFKNADTMGIPYTLLVNEDSLETGLLNLRYRDTTLCETIHLSDLPTYLVSLFLN